MTWLQGLTHWCVSLQQCYRVCIHAEGYELTADELAEFDDLCSQKVRIVDERDELVNQTEEERLR